MMTRALAMSPVFGLPYGRFRSVARTTCPYAAMARVDRLKDTRGKVSVGDTAPIYASPKPAGAPQ